MTVGKLSVISWTIFVVMSVAFLPAILAVNSIAGLPHPVKFALSAFIIVVVWWGPFVYGMYLSMVGMGNNDKRLLKRGIRGTAVVLEAKQTNTMIGGASDIGRFGRFVRLYHLRVTLPGQKPYETYCRITAGGFRKWQNVVVYAAPHNRKRVTIDVEASQPRIGEAPTGKPQVHIHEATRPFGNSYTDESARIHQLSELARLHREGSLTDAEFAAEKSRLLGN